MCMVFLTHGNHLSRESELEKNLQIGKGFRMIVSRKRLGRILNSTRKEVVMRTWPLSVIQGREKERVPTRRVILMEEHHCQGRRRT
jgi:hypothetical protein